MPGHGAGELHQDGAELFEEAGDRAERAEDAGCELCEIYACFSRDRTC